MTKQVDVAILGGGTGGYIAAIAAAQFGYSVVVIERDRLGGTCLHRGCIPSKSLLRSAEIVAQAKTSESFGIHIEGVKVDFKAVQARKQAVVDQLHRGVQYLMKKHNIEVIHGNGRVMGPSIFSPKSGSVAVELADDEVITVVPKHLIIATGSRPRLLPGLEPDGDRIATSDEALEWTSLPESVAIIGGGVIGIEWASLLHDFGVEVDLIEAGPRILPLEDADISKEMTRLLTKKGIRIHTSAAVESEAVLKDEKGVHLIIGKEGEPVTLTADRVLVSIGRIGNVEQLGLENTNVRIDRGTIQVNESLQTHEPHIYAIGDCIGGLQLAHAASAEGIAAVKHMRGESGVHVSDKMIPKCIYSKPEAASIGYTEEEARKEGYDVTVSKIPFSAIGKALVEGDTDGFVKVVIDQHTEDVLGVHIIGPHATELIGEASLAKLLNASPWELGQVIHAHPTLSEIMSEVMLAVDGKSLVM
ncbi:dihydrolipoyl dehydrogenase [Paenibacillus sp. 1001270B_150601_E10]|uniref:dihydrolipoyl dehydrogenase n=1 Tax=Paenibacillus sp. 1001270B_150601_E10 TaxID=2787079 RepID=UPI0018A03D92|nr:dihydrolipoyl dehydrogenase [Paenibacillus sp. 1001270B_150601_E10]